MTLIKITLAIAVAVELFSFICWMVLEYRQLSENVELAAETSAKDIISTTIPMIYLLFLILALIGIKKDEELIRSVDRIR